MEPVQTFALLLSAGGFTAGLLGLITAIWFRHETDNAIKETSKETEKVIRRLNELETSLRTTSVR